MAGLDTFTILFNSDSLKEFEQELKKNEQELEKTEKHTKALEDKLKDLNEQQAENKVKINETTEALTKARAELAKFNNTANQQNVKALEKQLAGLNNENLKITRSIKQTNAELDSAKNSAKNFQKTVTDMKNSTKGSLLQLRDNFIKLLKAVGALGFVGLTIRKSLNFYEQGEQLEFLAEKTGIAVEKLQQLGNAAKRYGGTTEGTAGTIENLRQQYQDARMNNASGGVKQAYLKYGFQISSDPEKTLERLAAKMETMKSDTAKWDLAKNLGIDEGTTRLLIQGQQRYNEELKKANKYKLYTKEDIQRMRDYRQISQDIRMGIESIFASISRALLPAITIVAKVIRSITDWLSAHSGAVKIAGVFLTIATGLAILKYTIIGITAAVKFFSKEAVQAWLKAFAPVVLGIALVTAIIALIQDFIVFLQGGDSIIGDILKKMGFNVDELRQNCLNFFNNIKDWVFKAIDWLKSLGGKFAELGNKIKELWNLIPEPLKKLITTGKEIIKQYNENKLNSVPQGATTAYYQTQSINNNNNNNAKTMNKNIVRTVNANGQTINIYDTDTAKMVEDKINAVYQLDNGQLA